MFKFKIGEECHYKLHKTNCIIERQILVTSICGTSKRYDLAIVGKESASCIEEALEEWIESGHRIE